MKKFLMGIILSLISTTAHAILIKKTAQTDNISIGISIGGTNIRVGLVSDSGSLITKPEEVFWRAELGKNATSENIVNTIMGKIEKLLASINDVKKITKIGISFAGPVDPHKGIVGTPFPAPNLPFNDYALASEIKKRFYALTCKKRTQNVIDAVITVVYNDSHAAALGEFGSDNNKGQDGMIFILGTGTNGAVLKKGKIYTDNDSLSELGFNLIKRQNGRWTFTGKDTKGNKPFKSAGEHYHIDLFSGAGIAKQFVKFRNAKVVAKNFCKLPHNITTIDQLFTLISQTDSKHKALKAEAVRTVLIGLTEATTAHDPRACQFVKEVGCEFGKSLSALIEHYYDAPWIKRIVLVGGVGEQFAKPKNRPNQSDIFIQSIRKSVCNQLACSKIKNLDWSIIQRIAKGIERSRIDWKREIIAARLEK